MLRDNPAERPDPNAALERVVGALSVGGEGMVCVHATDLRAVLSLLAAREPVASMEGRVKYINDADSGVDIRLPARELLFAQTISVPIWPGAKVGDRVRVEVHAIEETTP